MEQLKKDVHGQQKPDVEEEVKGGDDVQMSQVGPFMRDTHRSFEKFRDLVSPEVFNKAMTIFEYYMKHRFTPSNYLPGVDADPVVEIAKSVVDNRIKSVFVVGEAQDESRD